VDGMRVAGAKLEPKPCSDAERGIPLGRTGGSAIFSTARPLALALQRFRDTPSCICWRLCRSRAET
jgi:hypothetical protein